MSKKIFQKPILTENQLNRFSNIFDNAGQVILAVAVLSPMLAGFERTNLIVVISGVIVVILCWATSIWFAKKG